MIEKIISGGQTGADQGALYAAKFCLGLKTGGWAPRGYRTQDGPNWNLKHMYGLQEHSSWKYPPRTAANVRDSDGTLIFGNLESKGCLLTIKLTGQYNKPHFVVPWHSGKSLDWEYFQNFDDWIYENSIKVLNVAGNREHSNPGIFNRVCDFLNDVLKNK